MATRSGGFGRTGGLGGLTLDPFGSGKGGLGRYNISGDTIANLDALDRYATQVGWQNGTVSDADYLASLKKWADTADPGSREQITAQNSYDDAVYTIGRNKLVRAVNNSVTDAQRVAATRELISYDQTKLGTMKQDNEQRRELLDRINSSKADIREIGWSALVRKYNNNQLSTSALLDFAKRAAQEATGAPDQQQWIDRASDMAERMGDERLTQLQQDFQHDRVPAATVVAFVDQRMKGMNHNSPKYLELARWREDFLKSAQATDQAKNDALMRQKYDEGKISDAQWLTYMHERVQATQPGSSERKAAQHDLFMETFRIGESRLQYDIAMNGASPRSLKQFYQQYLSTMSPNSQLALDLKKKIRNLDLGSVNGIDLIGSGGLGSGSIMSGGTNLLDGGHWIGGSPPRNGGDALTGGGRLTANNFLASLAQSESGNNYYAQPNRAGAAGKYQFIPSTWHNAAARVLGDRNAPMTPANQDRVALAEVNRMFEKYGDWRVVAVAWNKGEGYVSKVIGSKPGGSWSDKFDYQLAHYNHWGEVYVRKIMRRLGVGIGGPVGGGGGGGGVPRIDLHSHTPTSSRTPIPVSPARTVTRASRVSVAQTTGGYQQPIVTPQTSGTPTTGATLPGALDDAARQVLRSLNVTPNTANVDVVAAWLLTENQGGKVSGNNPFNLRTAGMTDLPGQIGRDDQGYAVFNSIQSGIAAGAQEIARYPQLVASLRSNNAATMANAIENSGWGKYDGKVIHQYNGLPGVSTIITGSTVLTGATSMSGLARQVPEISQLYNADPTDPAQMDWFGKNFASLKTAYDNYSPDGSLQPGKWTFTTLDGKEMTLDFDPRMYLEAAKARAGYAYEVKDWDTKQRYDEIFRSGSANLSIDEWRSQVDTYQNLAEQALNNGDLSGMIRYKLAGLELARNLLGLGPGEAPDIQNNKNPLLADADLQKIDLEIRKIAPSTTDNPTGDRLLALADPQAPPTYDGSPAITVDAKGNATLSPWAGFWTQDQGTGKPTLVTYLDAPQQFAPQQEPFIEGQTAAPSNVPAYALSTVQISGGGVPVRVVPSQGSLMVSTLDPAGYKGAGTPPTNGPMFSQDDIKNLARIGAVPMLPFAAPIMDFALSGVNAVTGVGDIGINPKYLPGGGGAGAQQPVPATSAPDYQLTLKGNTIVPTVRYMDASTGKWVTAYNLSGDWRFGAQVIVVPDGADQAGPRLILNTDNARVTAGQIEVKDPNGKWVKFDAGSMKLSDYAHWYGQSAQDGAKSGEFGAPGTHLSLRTYNGANDSFDLHMTAMQQSFAKVGTGAATYRQVEQTQRDITLPGFIAEQRARERETFPPLPAGRQGPLAPLNMLRPPTAPQTSAPTPPTSRLDTSPLGLIQLLNPPLFRSLTAASVKAIGTLNAHNATILTPQQAALQRQAFNIENPQPVTAPQLRQRAPIAPVHTEPTPVDVVVGRRTGPTLSVPRTTTTAPRPVAPKVTTPPPETPIARPSGGSVRVV